MGRVDADVEELGYTLAEALTVTEGRCCSKWDEGSLGGGLLLLLAREGGGPVLWGRSGGAGVP